MADTNPNSFLFKKPKATTPTTPDYTKVIGFGDAGSQVMKGTPLDANIKAPQVNPMGSTPVPVPTVTTTPQVSPDSMYKNPVPTVPTQQSPTKENPVVVREKPTTQVGGVDYSSVDGLDSKGLQRYVDEWQVKASMGEEIPAAERVKLLAASRRLNELTTAANTVDPYQAQIDLQTKARQEEEARLKAQTDTLMTAEEKRLAAKYANLTSQAQQSGDRTLQAGQKAMSFSGLGRSTFNADQQSQIQQQTENNLTALEQEKQLALEKERLRLQGYTSEQLAGYDDRISQLRDKSASFQLQQAEQLNKFNQDNQATYQEKINNLMAYASNWTDPNTPLTEQELATAKAYGQIAIDKDGNVNTALLKEIDPKIMGEVIRSAAEARGAIPKEAPETASDGAGNLYQFNPQTNGWEKIGEGKPTPVNVQEIIDPKTQKKVSVIIGEDGIPRIITPQNSPQGLGSTNATQLISKWEGFRDKAYQDSAGVWTVGFGFTNLSGRPVQPGDSIDRASAEQLLQKEIGNRQNFMKYITVPLNEGQKAALTSFEYNLGSGIWDKNAKPILDKVNQGDLAGAANLMKQYINAGGKPIQGLVNRRNEEAQLLQSTGSDIMGGGASTQANIQDITLPEKATEFKAKSLTFAQRMQEADKKLTELGLEDTYVNRSSAGQMFQERVPKALKSQDQKALDIYKQSFIAGILRQESGAAISDQEFDRYETQFFPQPGDSKETVASKQALRKQAVRNMYQQVGVDAEGTPIVSIYDSSVNQTPTTPATTASTRSLDDLRNNL